MKSKTLPVAIVGAGISGLAAAQVLQQANVPFRIFEKSRGVGGRLATRRMTFEFRGKADAVAMDHGAQFISAFHPDFQQWVANGLKAGLLQPYFERRGTMRYQSPTGMNALAKEFVRGLGIQDRIHLETQVGRIGLEEHQGFHLEWSQSPIDSSLQDERYSAVLLTAPVPQSLELLKRSFFSVEGGLAGPESEPLQTLAALHYAPCIAGLFVLDTRRLRARAQDRVISFQTQEVKNPEGIEWISSVRNRGGSIPEGVEAWTVHLGAQWSQRHWDLQTPEELTQAILEQLTIEGYLDSGKVWNEGVLAHSVQKWRYSLPIENHPMSYFELPVLAKADGKRRHSIWICGDAFQGSRVEGAFLSGRAAAASILKHPLFA